MASMWMRWRTSSPRMPCANSARTTAATGWARRQIRENFQQWSLGEGDPYSVLHAVTNPLIRLIDETTAHGRWYLLDLRTTEGVDNPLILFGIYDDVYHKVDGNWLIHRTRIDFLWPKRHVGEPRSL